MKKRVLSVLLCTAMAVSMFAGCGGSDNGGESESDKAYVEDKGTLVVGITNFEPMDYKDESGEWVGFDADLAKAFAESLGVEAEFVEIDWDNKIMELDGKTIDCVWNGRSDKLHGLYGCISDECTGRGRSFRCSGQVSG